MSEKKVHGLTGRIPGNRAGKSTAEPSSSLTIRIPDSLRRQVEAAAEAQGISVSKVVKAALDAYLTRTGLRSRA